MVEEVNEFYEAIENQNIDDTLDEALVLRRNVQQFQDSQKVKKLWERVKKDIFAIFENEKKSFEKAFVEWHTKKIKKGQAMGLKIDDLIGWADMKF